MKHADNTIEKIPAFKKARIWGLIILTLALTVLSVKAQYNFWKGLFGETTAVIASSVFEILRIASLYLLIRASGIKKAVGMALYFGIALFCGSVAVTSWYSEIIRIDSDQKAVSNVVSQVKIDEIKAKYAMLTNQKIASIEKDINWVDSRLAANPYSQYWTNRKKQLMIKMDDLNARLEAFLTETPDDQGKWIEKYSALLGLTFNLTANKTTRYESIERAVQNTWHMTAEKARKFVALVFVIMVECGILLLASMIEFDKKCDGDVIKGRTLVTILEKHFVKGDIIKFFKKHGNKIINTGNLPKTSELSVNFRPIKKAIAKQVLNQEELLELYNYYSNNK